MARLLATIGFAAGACGLILQFAISIPASMTAGRSLVGSLVWFFSFFTILTNIGVALAHLATLTGAPGWFARSRVRAGLAVAITVVCIVYATILARLWRPEGLFLLADVTLHYAAPILYVAWWLGFGRKVATRLADIGWWLIYPLAYLGWVLARGSVVGEYPYPFLDLNAKSAAQVAQSSMTMLGLFVAVSLAAVAADRLLPRPKAS